MVAAAPVLNSGDVLAGRYVLRERIGEGGMGIVFRAEQPTLARSVAIKILHPELASDAASARRFRHEARAASRVRHPGAVSILDCDFAAQGAPFIVMEYVEGRTLGRLLAQQELSLHRALSIADQILWALEATHDCGVIHADVKSDNFLIGTAEQARRSKKIAARTGGDVVTMIDFGLAVIDGLWINSGFVSGTPEYMAPELIRGKPPTVATDLYGVGVILYEMLTGMVPFTGSTSQEILTRQLEDEVIAPSLRRPDRGIPPVLDAIVLRALDKDPARRFASARELAAAVRAALEVCEGARGDRCYICGARAEAPGRCCPSCGAVVRPRISRPSMDAPTRDCGPPRRRRARTQVTGPDRDEPRRVHPSAG